jgi:thymidylate synthase
MSIAQTTPKFPYKALYKPNQLICGYGQTAIITGWTVKQAIARRLDAEEYAVVGNLYSPTRGISPLLRNLIANPHVRFLVVLNATKEDRNSGSGQCLLDFFRRGFTLGKSDTGRDCWKINSEITGYIDIEIDGEILEKVREAIEVQEAGSIEEVVTIVKSYDHRQPIEAWGEALTFPVLETIPSILPGTRYGHRIDGKTIAETWVKILHRINSTDGIRW